MINLWNIPVESDTTILFSEKITIGIFEVMFQKWTWDGIVGESIIFTDYDVSELTDEEIFILTRLSMLVDKGSEMKLVRSKSGYTFVNFNFH